MTPSVKSKGIKSVDYKNGLTSRCGEKYLRELDPMLEIMFYKGSLGDRPGGRNNVLNGWNSED